jgi:nitroreductase
MLSFPVEANRKWMKDCGGIAVILAKTESDYNGQLDPSAQYCCGLAVGQMLVEISALGLHSHQIGGFNSKELAAFLGLPDSVIPMAMMAVGRTSEEPSKDRKREPLKVLVLR